jgi:hypothetical protein
VPEALPGGVAGGGHGKARPGGPGLRVWRRVVPGLIPAPGASRQLTVRRAPLASAQMMNTSIAITTMAQSG